MTTGKPDDIPQDVWDAALHCTGVGGGHEMQGVIQTQRESIARAILAAKAEERQRHADLVDCLSDMTEHYVQLAGCGDCGFWDPEAESEVIAARQMIARHRKHGEA